MADTSMLVKTPDGNMVELKLIELTDGTYAVAVALVEDTTGE